MDRISPSTQAVREVVINGGRLQYVEQGSGEPMVFLHGAPSDLSHWKSVREGIASRYRFVAYTQRYFGTEPWPDDGRNFSIQNLADDLTGFIKSLNAGPVHLVAWSYGGLPAMSVAVNNPSLVRSLILYEPAVISVLPAESVEGKLARDDRSQVFAPAVAAYNGGDTVQAAKLIFEGAFQLGPGGFDRVPQADQARLLDNARVVPLLLAAPPPPNITCDQLKTFRRPTLVVHGEKTRVFYALISEAISKCIPGARLVVLPNVGHDGPSRDPAAFTRAVFEFLSGR